MLLTGLTYGQLYSYPANRWKKRKRLAFMNTESRVNKSNDIETGESGRSHRTKGTVKHAYDEVPRMDDSTSF